MAEHWYVLRTKPRSEALAGAEMERSGYEVLLPLVEESNPLRGRTVAPLFPGYLFLRCGDGLTEFPSLSLRSHVLGWVNFGGAIPTVPDEIINALKDQLDTIGQGGGLWKQYEAGEMVEVVSGNVQSMATVVEAPKSPQAKVKVLMEFMGRLVSAQVPWENLRQSNQTEVKVPRRGRRTRGGGRWLNGAGPRALAST